MVTIKSPREIDLMREAGKILSEVHDRLSEIIKPGISTYDIDRKGEELIRHHGCIPSFLGYEGYPASVCVSVNDEVVHGIPDKHRYLEEGDIVSLDTGVIYKGYQSDAARTYGVGKISDEASKLIEVTRECFFAGIDKAREGNHLSDIAIAIQELAESHGYGVVRDLVGHGIGSAMHEDPEVPNFYTGKKGIKLHAGMTLAIEPMINLGTWEVDFDEIDGWTVRTADGNISAHYENTILITDDKPEILSLVS